MADTIREIIIQELLAKLSEITVANGYQTGCGANVQRAAFHVSEEDLPAINIVPRPDESVSAENDAWQTAWMPIEVQAIQLHEELNPSVIGEQVLGDLISCVMGHERALRFTSGGTYQVLPGDTITGATSEATARVLSVIEQGGDWASGTAKGLLVFWSQIGTFQAENLDVGANLNVATITGNSSVQAMQHLRRDGLIDNIEYGGGGIENYPGREEVATIVQAVFRFRYSCKLGNPYQWAF